MSCIVISISITLRGERGRSTVLPSATKHGITAQALLEAWENFAAKRPRGDDCWVSIGFDAEGHEIEMVGLVTADGRTLIIHGMSPATERMRREMGIAR